MKFSVNFFGLLLISSLVSAANDIQYSGTSTHFISRTTSSPTLLNGPALKPVTVMNVYLSDAVKNTILKNISRASLVSEGISGKLPPSVQLGMNNVPVMDQGRHGTCVTFALIAALDAILGQGDYYSALCSLSLGQYLAKSGYSVSGWNGQLPKAVLARIDEFGLVSKENQRLHGCGGMKEYPVDQSRESDMMTIENFHAMSTQASDSNLAGWSTLFDISQWLLRNISSEQIIEQTKRSLYHRNRVIIGMLLPPMQILASMGTYGKFHVNNDTWVLTGPLEQDIRLHVMDYDSWGGHALIITGYDDNAVAVDNYGIAHKGLFTLRNSWGEDVGDKGDFYIAYDYFSVLTLELDELIQGSH
jgi:hypothetical protein